jgi:hypothetical protein
MFCMIDGKNFGWNKLSCISLQSETKIQHIEDAKLRTATAHN